MMRIIAVLLIGVVAFFGLRAAFMKNPEPSEASGGVKKFGLIWPIDCVPHDDCAGGIGYPDINKGDSLLVRRFQFLRSRHGDM